MNDALRMGVIKSVYFANALREYDGDEDAYEGEEKKTPIPRMLVVNTRTSIVIQLVSVFDEGLQEYLARQFAGKHNCDRLRNRVEFVKARGLFKWPDRCVQLVQLRNELAHVRERYATWDEWRFAFRTVGCELEHLGIISPLEAPPGTVFEEEPNVSDEWSNQDDD
jgi:hypothetical protein